jgi:DNA-binding transcriptional ArsR family regulator
MVELTANRLDLIFHALADPTRRAILKKVSRKARTVGEVAQPFSMSLAAVSKHLKILEHAELIRKEKRGTSYYVSLRGEALFTAEQWISHYRQFWESRLDSLKDYLEGETK